MVYIYLITALFLGFVATFTHNDMSSNLVLRFPAIVGCVVYGILTAKGFGLI